MSGTVHEGLDSELEDKVRRAVRERKRWEAMRKAFATSLAKQQLNEPRMRGLEERKDRLAKVRERWLLDPELIEEAVRNMEAAGFRVRRAKDGKHDVRIVRHNLPQGVKHDLDALVGAQQAKGQDGRLAGRAETLLERFRVPKRHIWNAVMDETNPFFGDTVAVVENHAGAFGHYD